MNKKRLLGLIPIIVIVCCTAILLSQSTLAPTSTDTPHELDFSVTGKNDCLRFLNSSVSTVYIPVVTGTNERWELTINATKMAGGPNGWVDLYTYDGYWNGGVNNTCVAKDVYPILTTIVSADVQVKASEPYTQTFGGSAAESHTLFFIFPPGGPSTFHITLKRI